MSLTKTSKSIASIIRSTPLPFALLAFRAYNTVLRLLFKEIRVTTYFGSHMNCNPNDLVQNFILLFGIWEPEVSKVIESNLAPGDVFVDIGANVGHDSLLASWCVGQSGKVVAIEALPSTFALLQANLALNGTSTNVRAVNVAVSDKDGKLDIFAPLDYERKIGPNTTNIGMATTVAGRGGRAVGSVDALPLTSILTPDEIKRVRLVKIDVEGAEPPILRNLIENLSDYPSEMDLIVEISLDDHEAWHDVFERITSAGFSAYAIPNEYSREFYIKWNNQSSPLQKIDTLPDTQQDVLFTRRKAMP